MKQLHFITIVFSTMHHHEEPISVYSSSIDDIEDLVGPALARAVNTPTTDDCLRLPKHAPSSVPSDIYHPSESSTVHSLASASFVSFDSGWPHIAVGKTSMSFTTTDYTCVVESKAEVQDLTSPSQVCWYNINTAQLGLYACYRTMICCLLRLTSLTSRHTPAPRPKPRNHRQAVTIAMTRRQLPSSRLFVCLRVSCLCRPRARHIPTTLPQ
jgi:hypothetical protein